MPPLNERILSDLKTAMKAKDALAVATLRSLKAALEYAAIAEGRAGTTLSEAEAQAVVRKQIKQRQDSATSFDAGGRGDLAEKERAEIRVLEGYLPPPLSDAEIAKIVDETIAALGATDRSAMGAVMKALQEQTGGAVDNKRLAAAVQERLS